MITLQNQSQGAHSWKRSLFSVFLALPLLFLSCNPVSTADVLRGSDIIPPEITITSPADGGSYAATLSIAGTVSDKAAASGAEGFVQTLSYQVSGTVQGGTISIGNAGSFSLTLPTSGLPNPLTIVFTAVDWNSNSSQSSLTLHEGAFSNLAVTAGNSQLTLSWDPVDLAESYTLYYTTDGSTPSASNYQSSLSVSNPSASLFSLNNGTLYTLVIQALSSSGPDNWSDPIQGIPLTKQTLQPSVTGEHGQIRLEWQDIEAVGPGVYYRVERAVSPEGSFSNISGSLNTASYTDTSAADGILYYYRIVPTVPGSIASSVDSGETVPFTAAPTQTDLHNTTGTALDIHVSGDYAFLADGPEGVRIYSLSDPLHPTLVKTVPTSDYVWAVTVQNGYAYAASDSAGLEIIDISSIPDAAVVKTVSLDTNEMAVDVTVQATWAYLAMETAGIKVIDISTLSGASAVHSVDTEEASGLTASGSNLYVADGNSGLQILDITTPDSATIAHTAAISGRGAEDVVLNGDYAYVSVYTDSPALDIFDISTPSSATQVHSVDLPGYPSGLLCIGNLIYIADSDYRIHVVDISNPTAASLVKSFNAAVAPRALATYGSALYSIFRDINDGDSGLETFAITSPVNAVRLASLDLTGEIFALDLEGDTAAAAAVQSGTYSVDISDPAAPALLDNIDGTPYIFGTALSGGYIYASEGYGDAKIHILDALVPSALEETLVVDINGSDAYDSLVAGPWAWVPASANLVLLDIETPPAATVSRTIPGFSSARAVARSGDILCVGESQQLTLLDISDPTSASEVGSVALTNSVYDVAAAGDYAFVVDYTNFYVIDISNPNNPTIVKTIETPHNAYGVEIAGDYAFVADGYSGIHIYDTSDPGKTYRLTTVDTPDSAQKIKVRGKYAYIADNSTLEIIDLAP